MKWTVQFHDMHYHTPEQIEAMKPRRVWTLGNAANGDGWETDSGQEGYGLTYDEAKELADAANAITEEKGRYNVLTSDDFTSAAWSRTS